jgi:protein-tyrosine phosphatase
MAERFAAAYAVQHGYFDFRASSAGTRAVIAHPIHDNAAAVLEERGIDSSDFSARQLTARMAVDADLILTMSKSHRDSVLEYAPNRLHRTFTLTEAARIASDFEAGNLADFARFRPRLNARTLSDIPDPIGQSAEVFATVGAQIFELLSPVLKTLMCQLGHLD